ncbi:MAG: Xaa-Pro peptidase family protein [Bacillota bacterium]
MALEVSIRTMGGIAVDFLSRGTFAQRHDRIRAFLEREGYDAFVTLTPDNFYYVSGFFLDVAPWERPVAAVIPSTGDPFLIMNELSTNHVRMALERESLAVADIHFWREHPSSSDRYFTRLQWTGLLAQKLRERGIDRGILACDSSYAAIENLREDLPGVELVVESGLLREMRLVKSSEELQFIRAGARLSDFGQDRFAELVSAGKLVSEVDTETLLQMRIRGADMFPGTRLECRVSSLSGPASASPHGTGAGSDDVFEAGHGIVNIIIVRLNGYVVENERTWIIGEPDELQERAFRAATAATEAAAARMVAGNPTSSIDSAAQRVIEAAGFGSNIRHRTGHGIGIAGHEYPDDVAFNHRQLKAGEVWSAEPGIYIYGVGGFRHDDTVIVGTEEPEVVTKHSKNIEDQIIPLR